MGNLLTDPRLHPLIERHGPAPFHPNPVKVEPPFRTLVSSIVGQQLSGKAAETIWRRLEARYLIEPQALYQADPDDLRSLGLSRAKASYVIDLSRFALEGGLEDIETQPDQEIIAHLIQVKGIGVWSVQMFLMFGLGRPDVWPVLDLGIRKGAQRLYGVTTQVELLELGERFRPYRSHAAWYLWRALEKTQ
ncbi:MAG TPA: DNA-3-methyladenine glycosylase [Meiothermus sp.]|nr:DNA-3-methyladenine glycosylase [Meiothermus sp.]